MWADALAVKSRQGLKKTFRKLLRSVANYDPDYYDMYADPAESLFAQSYLEHFIRHAREASLSASPTVLEAGCQTGRLAIPLAKAGFLVTGIDRSGFALRRAKSHARQNRVSIDWVQGDFMELKIPLEKLFDMVVCAEVVYQVKHYREMLAKLAQSVRPGGLLFVSHRLRAYYIVESLRHEAPDVARRVAESSEGLFDSRFHRACYFNWQTASELRTLYAQLGLSWVDWHPIDRLAWVCQGKVDHLGEAQRRRWLDLESQLPKEDTSTARYALGVSKRP